jgi:hypothetical protein
MSARHLRRGTGKHSVNDLSIDVEVFPRLPVRSCVVLLLGIPDNRKILGGFIGVLPHGTAGTVAMSNDAVSSPTLT